MSNTIEARLFEMLSKIFRKQKVLKEREKKRKQNKVMVGLPDRIR